MLNNVSCNQATSIILPYLCSCWKKQVVIPHSTLTFTHAASFLCSIASDLALKERIWSISDPIYFSEFDPDSWVSNDFCMQDAARQKNSFLAAACDAALDCAQKKKARVFSCFQADSSLGKGPNYFEIFWDNSTFHALHVDVTTFWCHMENSSFFTTVVMSYIFASDKPCFLANKCWEDYGDLRRLLRKDRATNSLRCFARKKGEGVLQERYTDLLRPSINIYILYKHM